MSDDSETDPVGSEEMFEDEEDEEEADLVGELCKWLNAFVIIFSLSTMFLVFAVPSALATTPGSATHVIAVLNVIGAGAFSIGSLSVIGACRARE